MGLGGLGAMKNYQQEIKCSKSPLNSPSEGITTWLWNS